MQRFSTKGPASRPDCAGRLFQSCVCMNNTVFLSFLEKIYLIHCAFCEWTNRVRACIIKPETREVQQKLKWELTPLTLSRKERRPMVDMEPAQYAQTVGVRWEAKQRLTTNGMFPPYKNTKTEPVLSIKNAITRQPVDSILPQSVQIDPLEMILMKVSMIRRTLFE